MANPKLAVLEKDLGSIENGVINQGKVGSLTGWRGAADSGAAVGPVVLQMGIPLTRC